MIITLAHGSGGKSTSDLINEVFSNTYGNEILSQMEDSSVVDGYKKIAITTDSFVVNPIFFNGGDIGKLAVCGTVNDLLMRGSKPQYITVGFIIEEGIDSEDLKRIACSIADTANEAGVLVVAGDTKVIEGNGGVYINTTGVGFIDNEEICSKSCKEDDVIILSGNIGDHHTTILSERMNISNTIESDVAPLNDIVNNLISNSINIHTMRDVTRGGLGTVLNEISESSNTKIVLNELDIPIDAQVQSLASVLGLDIMHLGNEGKMIVIVPSNEAKKALEIVKNSKYGENAKIIGKVEKGNGVFLTTKIGGLRRVSVLRGEGLPRIC